MTTNNNNNDAPDSPNSPDAAFLRLQARLRAQQDALRAAAADQRRQAEHSDYLYDKTQDAYWDRVDGRLFVDRAVDASIPRERWRAVVEEAEEPDEETVPEGPRGGRRGRPRRARTRLVRPSEDIRQVENGLFVEGSTWWPGRGEVIEGWLVDGNGPRQSRGARLFNTYRPPALPPDAPAAAEAGRWVQHVRTLFPQPEEHEHFFNVCAHMVQRPHEKCNSAVVMSGSQGIGKDAALLPVRMAVGHWNTRNIDPDDLFSQYRPWVETLMLTIDEVRPAAEEFRATTFYNILKPLIAAPPDTLPLNDKYAKLRYVINLLRVFITTNDWLALFIPDNDRRMFIMNSSLQPNWQPAGYFESYWAWLEEGGGAWAVARWLAERDLSTFNPKAPPPKTQTWHAVSSSWDSSEHEPVQMALEEIGRPNVIITSELLALQCEAVGFDYRAQLESAVRNPRKLANRMSEAGYTLVPPPGQRWEFEGAARRIRSKTAFVRRDLGWSVDEARAAVRERGRALVSGQP